MTISFVIFVAVIQLDVLVHLEDGIMLLSLWLFVCQSEASSLLSTYLFSFNILFKPKYLSYWRNFIQKI